MKIPEGYKVLHIAYENEKIIPTTQIKAFSKAIIVTTEQFDYIMANPDRLVLDFPYEVDELIKDYRALVIATLIHEDGKYWLLHKQRRIDELDKSKPYRRRRQ